MFVFDTPEPDRRDPAGIIERELARQKERDRKRKAARNHDPETVLVGDDPVTRSRPPGRPRLNRKCSMYQCGERHHAKGLCNTHYRAYRRQQSR